MITRTIFLLFATLLCGSLNSVQSFTLTMMGSRRGKGGMKITDGPSSKGKIKNQTNALNNGRGQEITGVTMPALGNMKGWEFGEGKSIACANVDGNYYAVQGNCPRCGFDLYKGDIITDEAFDDLPRIACPTCATTFGLKTGYSGPALKRTGLAGFVTGLAKSATMQDAYENAKAFVITRDDESQKVYMRER
jgi:nitrite reductase/ring-hydroxylating ferredoxin subunit